MTTSSSNHKKLNRQDLHYILMHTHTCTPTTHMHTRTRSCMCYTRACTHTHTHTHTHRAHQSTVGSEHSDERACYKPKSNNFVLQRKWPLVIEHLHVYSGKEKSCPNLGCSYSAMGVVLNLQSSINFPLPTNVGSHVLQH